MNLHEIYEMLMRRGMPKHRDLVWTAFAEPCVACALDGDVAILTTNTARDLIAMHALRWALGRLDSETARNAVYMEVFSDGSCVIERGGEVLGESDRDILAATLAATEHLEPKGDDDAKRP